MFVAFYVAFYFTQFNRGTEPGINDCISVLKLLKMARSVRTLLDTVMQALPEVGNLGLLFFLLFYIFAALGVELFGRIGEHAFYCCCMISVQENCLNEKQNLCSNFNCALAII